MRLIHCALIFLATALSAGMSAGADEAPFFEKRIISGSDAGSQAIAIPKMVVTAKGTVLVAAQDREGGDWGKKIDPIFLRSLDGGKTWSKPSLMIPDDFPGRDRAHMKPTGLVVDRLENRLFAFISRSPLQDRDGKPIHERDFYRNIRETRGLGRAWFLVTSDDEGKTWSTPHEITEQLIKKNHWQEWSPVHTGVQLRYGSHEGRLVVPVRCYCPDKDPGPHDLKYQHNGVIFSDDSGAHWIPGGRSEPYLGECCIAERSDGSIYVNHRTSHHAKRKAERMQNTSRDGGVTFTECVPSGMADARCHAGLAVVTGPTGKRLFLLSHVPGPKRRQLTLSLSRDQGETWLPGKVIESGHAAYSDLAVLQDRTILCVYETGEETSRKHLGLARFNLAWALEGRDEASSGSGNSRDRE